MYHIYNEVPVIDPVFTFLLNLDPPRLLLNLDTTECRSLLSLDVTLSLRLACVMSCQVGAGFGELSEWANRVEKINQEIEAKEERWMELLEIAEGAAV